MITFLNKITDTRTQKCTAEIWERLIASPPNKQYVEMFRETGDVKWKQLLPAVNFHGYDPKVLTEDYGSRKQENLVPTGLFMLDVDHVEDPKAVWEKFKQRLTPLPPQGGTLNSSKANSTAEGNNNLPLGGIEGVVALVHITPSGKGLRIVMKGREGSTIKDDQQWLATLLCVQHDECTKDLSRWSFVPQAKDILFINPEILFSPTPTLQSPTPTLPPGGGGVKNDSADGNPYAKAYANKSDSADVNPYAKAYANKSDSANGNPYARAYANKSDSAAYAKSQTADENSQSNSIDNLSPTGGGAGGGLFPSTYRGISYEKIVDTLIQYHGGTPEVGERHHTIIALANDLRSITDSNVDWLVSLIPNFDKPDYEKRDAVTWAVQHNSLRRTKALSAVLDWFQNGKKFTPEQASEEEINDLDEEAEDNRKSEILKSIPQMPEKLPALITLLTSKVMPFQRPAVAQMVFPSLAAHVADSIFINNENKKFELALMGVVVGKQSVGKGCIDAPTECIIQSIIDEDEQAREELRAWSESQQSKASNDKGTKRPEKPIRIFNTDTTPAALLANLYNAEHFGYAKNLCCFTKSEEIEELYDMSPTSGRSKIAQLIKKTYDRGRIGSERYTSSAANYTTVLRWNWVTACTPDKAKAFFKRVLVDGTLSRVDFATIISAEEDIKFVYGDYDEAFEQALEPYIQNLRNFRCEHDKRGRLVPFRLQQLVRIEEEMDDYIREYSKLMPDDTWRNFAWRTKLNALKKIIVLYIANGGKWEESFGPFCWWSFYYAMWVKMNLFYEKASEAFGEENIVANVWTRSPLELVSEEFTRKQIYEAFRQCGRTSPGASLLNYYEKHGVVKRVGKDEFKKLK